MEEKIEKRSLRYDFTASETHDLAIQLAQETRKDNGVSFVEKMESYEWNLFNQDAELVEE